MSLVRIRRALLSVSDKTGLVAFAKQLKELEIEILSTGGTSEALKEAGIPHQRVEEVTQFPEIFNGRVKTLHPLIHGGILGKRDQHALDKEKHGIEWIDLVVVNLYPFTTQVTSQTMSWDEVVEYIDVGGPTMIRAAAKNFAWVSVVTDPNDYPMVIQELQTKKGLQMETRRTLAEKAFALTSSYDAAIHHYFMKRNEEQEAYPHSLHLHLEKITTLRYGENPHQRACAYGIKGEKSILSSHQHQGKPLSYNNLLDAEASIHCVKEFHLPACVIVKHANPCGVAVEKTIDKAYQLAYQADPLSAFGGIVALNEPCTKKIAEAITSIFMEVVIAPAFTKEALAIFSAKPNLRVLEVPDITPLKWEMRFITGGVLLQEKDQQTLNKDALTVVTEAKLHDDDIPNLLFAWQVVKHIKSNGILIARNQTTQGIGAGQVSRIDAVESAIRKAGANADQAVLASDAFFPFRDSIDRIAQSGVRAIIQPGGSLRDQEVIAACNEHGLVMAFTGLRCFRH